jgi:hypothetical protein
MARDTSLRKIKPAVYQTVADLDRRIAEREAEALQLVPGAAKQSILREIAQLRAYADMKRWVARPPKWADK